MYDKISFGNIVISGKLSKTGEDMLAHVVKREATGICVHNSRVTDLYAWYLAQSQAH